MSRIRLGARFRYWFDSLISRGAWVLVLWMLAAALVMVVIVAAIAVLFGVVPAAEDGQRLPFLTLVWTVLMHAIDPGTITAQDGRIGWLAVLMLATVVGILMIGGLVGIMVEGVAGLFEDLRKGRSIVLEEGHTLVVGWSRQVFTIVTELAKANESRGRGCIVILADEDKLEMEEQLRANVGSTRPTKVVVRAGDPTDPVALEMVSPARAKAIVVLAPDDARSDTHTIRSLLAVGRHAVEPGLTQHVVAEINDPKNASVARLTSERRLETLEVGQLVAQLSVQTCLQSGLSAVYEEILSFDGNEIYFHEQPDLAGHSYAEALRGFSDATPMGVRNREGKVFLNPAMDRIIEAGEALIILAEDDDRIGRRERAAEIDESALTLREPEAAPACRTLILGWSTRAQAIITGIDCYVPKGSSIVVVADDPEVIRAGTEIAARLTNASLECRTGNTTERGLLDELHDSLFDHVLVLSDDRIEDIHEADARSLVTLLHLRDIAANSSHSFSTVSEMRDLRSRDLGEAARADDFIISDRLLGLLLSQIAEHPDLAAVFQELFDPEGAEIYLRPARDYVRIKSELDFDHIVAAASRKGESAIGIRQARSSEDPSRDFGIVLNPHRDRRFVLHEDDRVIVVAND